MTHSEEDKTEWLQTYEKKIQELGGVDQAAIIVREASDTQSLGTIRVMDLIPNLPSQPRPAEQIDHEVVRPEQRAEDMSNPLALSYGGDLTEPEDIPRTLPLALRRATERAPHKGIIYINNDGSEDFQTYPQLLTDAERILAGLRQFGLRPGDKVIFQIDDNRGFISCHWACILGGFVLVPISIAPTYQERNLTVNKLINAWESLGRPIIITTQDLGKQLAELAVREGLMDFRIAIVEQLMVNERDLDWADAVPDDLVILLLTSGSTGKPKLVEQRHRSLLYRSAGTIQLNGFSGKEVSLNWMPLDHVGGIVMWHIRDVYLACQQIHVPTQMILEKPLMWLDLIDRHKATLTWAPNFAYGLINDQLAKRTNTGGWDLSSMRSILNAGEAVVSKTARRFLSLLHPYGLPEDSMQPAWGMSETCSAVTHSSTFSLKTTKDQDQFVSVGVAIPGFSMRIVDEKGQIMREGEIGQLHVKGFPVTSGYHYNPKANEEAFSKDGWFNTGDLGLIRDGQLAITGRGKGEIIINGINYYSHEIESVVESIDGVDPSFTAATAVRDHGDDTDKLAIFFHPSSPEWDERMELVREVRKKLTKAFGIHVDYIVPVERKDIPKTAIGKIQRSLLGKQLMGGEFDELIRKVDVQTETADTVPNWFYRKLWVSASTEKDVNPVSMKGHCLVFMDDLGLGTELTRTFDRIDQKYIQVAIGEEFVYHGENRFSISPAVSEHYERLITTLAEKGISINTVVHLWGYSAYRPVDNITDVRNTQDLGIYSLLALIHGMNEHSNTDGTIRLFLVTSYAQAAASNGPLAYEKTTLPGFIKAAALDLPWLQCRHLDFEVTDSDGKHFINELSYPNSAGEIAYRGGVRMESRLSSIDMLAEKPGKLPLEVGGVYLITGGLGGIGSYLAQRLMSRFGAKVILVGRTNLSEDSTVDAGNEKDNRLEARIRSCEDIVSLSAKSAGEFVYQTADISDLTQLERTISSAESKWGMPLSGIFHLAGDLDIARHWETADSHRVGSEQIDAFESMFRAKVYGTWNLFQIIRQRPEAFFVGFSSVVGELGAATFGAYCAGNSFLDGCCQYYDRTLPQDVFSFKWSMWQEMGINKGNPQYAQQAAFSMGNMAIEPESGWNSLLAGLCRKDHEILVGLNGLNPHIRSRLDKRPEIRTELKVYVTTQSGSPLTDALREQVTLILQDSKYPFDISKIDAMPMLEGGSLDIETLHRLGRNEAAPTGAPETDAEREIAAIWSQVLGIKKIRNDVNFFELGGTSIQLAQVNGQLKAAFGRDTSMTDLFQFPTVSSLARFLTSSTADSLITSLSESEDRAAGRRTRMLSRKRSSKRPSDIHEHG